MRDDLGGLLSVRARQHPDEPFLTFTASGERLTYGQFDERVDRVAAALAALGVEHGDPVNVMLPNRPENLLTSYALKRLGAIEVAINSQFRGPALARMLQLAGASLLITSSDYAEPLDAIAGELGATTRVVVQGDAAQGPRVARAATVAFGDLEQSGAPDVRRRVADTDPATVIFTSGTTGVSKGCVLSHRMLVRSAEAIVDACALSSRDVVYAPYPLFHIQGAYLDVLPALLAGGEAVVAPRFSASGFWPDMRTFGVTVFGIVGTVMQILWQRDPAPDDRDHRVRLAWGGPTPIDLSAFERRFGVTVLRGEHTYGMTEIGIVCMGDTDAELSGLVRPIYDVQVAGDDDRPLPAGEVGEILVRPREPEAIFQGYLQRDDATVQATRNLWFHTGDLGHLDAGGRLTFLARKREMIRRAGHNISTWEVEEGVGAHPDVLECAALGRPSSMGEEEVEVFVVARAGTRLDVASLLAFCRDRMAAFMVPQHVALVPEIPKTATGKPALGRLAALRATGADSAATP
jgi:crotonobetaine/carnitine-CoA ligase